MVSSGVSPVRNGRLGMVSTGREETITHNTRGKRRKERGRGEQVENIV